MRKNIKKTAGQALVILLFYMVIAITVTSAAVAIIIINSLSAADVQQGEEARATAEFGADNAYLQLLRNTGYTGEVINVNGTTANIKVSDLSLVPPVKLIVATGSAGKYERTIQAKIAISTDSATIGTLSVLEWLEK